MGLYGNFWLGNLFSCFPHHQLLFLRQDHYLVVYIPKEGVNPMDVNQNWAILSNLSTITATLGGTFLNDPDLLSASNWDHNLQHYHDVVLKKS